MKIFFAYILLLFSAILYPVSSLAQNTSTQSTTSGTTTSTTNLINQGAYDSKSLVDTNSTSNSTSSVTKDSVLILLLSD